MTETATGPSAYQAADAIERYVDFWNAEFSGDQRRLAALTFTDDVEYHAPVGVLRGGESLIDFRNELALQVEEDVAFRLVGEPDVVRDRARLRWEVRVGDASFAEGTDVLHLDGEGRITSVSAFLDRAPAGFDPEAHHEPAFEHEGRW